MSKRKRVVYVAHPLSGADEAEREANRERAKCWVAWVASLGYAPIADWIILSGFWAETPELRAEGLAIDKALVERADAVWLVGGRVSEGMRIEATHAKERGIIVHDLTYLGAEPPRGIDGEKMQAWLELET